MRTVTTREHTNREYEQELRRLREQLLLMGAKVEEIIRGSIRALMERETALAEQMIAFDKKINQLELEIDELCMQILARRQPVASDLRFITMALKLVTDLERIGDLGVNISERVVELNAEPPLKPYIDMPNMAREVQEMLHEALDAFVAADADRAQRVIVRDRNVDAYYGQIF
ncbi:MAG TPA: phosphate signaling complex protein PhoU, partial [Polyangia bacterium]|nr:phosphate signaling complex protein PhoU [Polyangia bacterium]